MNILIKITFFQFFYTKILAEKLQQSLFFNVYLDMSKLTRKYYINLYNEKNLANNNFILDIDNITYINKLLENKKISEKLFTICLNQKGGYLSIGKIENEFHELNKIISYIPFEYTPKNYYKIKIDSFEINNKIISYNNFVYLLTIEPVSYFPKKIYEQIIESLFSICNENSYLSKSKFCTDKIYEKGHGYCIETNEVNKVVEFIRKELTIIKIKLSNNKYFSWKPENYYFEISSDLMKKKICIGIDKNEENMISLGSNFFNGYDFIFDNSKFKLGFIEAECTQKREDKNNYLNKSKKEDFIDHDKNIRRNDKIKEKKYRAKINELKNKNYKLLIILALLIIFLLYLTHNKNKVLLKFKKKLSNKKKEPFLELQKYKEIKNDINEEFNESWKLEM